MKRSKLALQGRTAIVTGASGDIGFATAKRFLEAGARVALLDLDRKSLNAAAARLRAKNRVLAIACNVADPAATRAAVRRVARAFGGPHILFNNAATMSTSAPAAGLSIEEWRRTLDVNLTGAWLLAKWCIPLMAAAGGGVVINVASQLGQVGAKGRAAYGVTKAGLIALARAIAVDHAADNIRGVSLSPGAVMTSRLTRRYGSEKAVSDALARYYLRGSIGRPEEIAAAAVFLASDEASFINGSDLLADGGYTAV